MRSAWNVLSDPFQRQRYDARARRAGRGTTTSSSSTTTTATQPRTGSSSTGGASCSRRRRRSSRRRERRATATARTVPPPPTNKRRVPPRAHVVLPGACSSPSRANGAWRCCSTSPSSGDLHRHQLPAPGGDPEQLLRHPSRSTRSARCTTRSDLNDAQKCRRQDERHETTQKDIKSAQKDVNKATKDVKDAGIRRRRPATAKASAEGAADLRRQPGRHHRDHAVHRDR